MTNARPSLNPVNNDTLTGVLRQVLGKAFQNTDGMLPAQVVAYQAPTGSSGARVQVQPLITMLDTNGNQIPRGQIASVPVLTIGGGGFVINVPVQPGDLGWIVANDRDISLFLQSYAMSPPNTYRVKDFADSIFIPSSLKGYSIAPGDAGALTIQSTDGSIKIGIYSDKIVLQAPTVEVDGSLSVAGLTITSDGTTPNIQGNLFVNGFIAATQSITPFVPPPG